MQGKRIARETKYNLNQAGDIIIRPNCKGFSISDLTVALVNYFMTSGRSFVVYIIRHAVQTWYNIKHS